MSAQLDRIDAFRHWLADVIPVRVLGKPAREARIKAALHAIDLPKLLIIYLSWRQRLITPRPRTIVIRPEARTDPRWQKHEAEIGAFLKEVEAGADLTPLTSR